MLTFDRMVTLALNLNTDFLLYFCNKCYKLAYNRTLQSDWVTKPDACAVEMALATISGKWKLRIYDVLRKGESVRNCLIYNELKDISEKTLTAQLREMEQDGIITRIVYPEVPPRVEYQLTALGQSLQNVFDSLRSWGLSCIEYKKTGKVN